MGYTNEFSIITPDGDSLSDPPHHLETWLQTLKKAIQERWNKGIHSTDPATDVAADKGDHYVPLTGNLLSDINLFQHRLVTLREQASAPDKHADMLRLYGFLADSKCEFHVIDEDGNVIQMTRGGQPSAVMHPAPGIGTTDIDLTCDAAAHDLADCTVTLTTKGGDLMMWFTASFRNLGSEVGQMTINFDLDGSTILGQRFTIPNEVASDYQCFHMHYQHVGASAAEHIIKITYTVHTGTISQVGTSHKRILTVQELQ